MEQFDTDEKLVESSKDKKGNSSKSHYVFIGVCCLIVLCAIIFLFKYITSQNSSGKQMPIDNSKK